ncbi:STAS domain-containing protein [Streptomyces sp. AcE210]|uniref:STAS domain-containing protein n=1 Tax=Streptomyces sp. AcE210 TaxID=2292703 RepID=UPI000E2FF739|nr:STAS domain-containing protein [Streptomyces sp. AcE210]RFC76801.1 anti-sigma factor antagonist [Streptomyces sp. AcE210]
MSSDDPMLAVEATAGDVVLISVRGSLDGWSGCDGLARAAQGEAKRTVVDSSGLTFADSAALHALLHGRRKHTATGMPLVLAGPLHTTVHRLFEITGTREASRFVDSVEQARTC